MSALPNRALVSLHRGHAGIHIQPIVVPRKIENGRLYFHVVFAFPRLNDQGEILPQSDKATPPEEIPTCLKSTTKMWPEFIQEQLRSSQFYLLAEETNQQNVQAAKYQWDRIRLEVTPDLKAYGWNLKKSCDLWRDLFLKTLAESTKSAKPASADLYVAMMAAEPPELNLSAAYAIGLDIEADPTSASDLSPNLRLESLDQRALAATFQSAERAAELDRPGTEPMGVEIILALAKQQPERWLQFLTFHRQNQREEIADYALHLREIYDRVENNSDPKFGVQNEPKDSHSIRKQLANDGQFQVAAKELELAYHDFVLHEGQTQLRRQERFVENSRHRIPGGRKNAIETAFRDSQSDRRYVADLPPAETRNEPQLTFDRLLKQVRQHPGVMRRLCLSLYCSVEMAKGYRWEANQWQPLEPGNLPSKFSGVAHVRITGPESEFEPIYTACEFRTTASQPPAEVPPPPQPITVQGRPRRVGQSLPPPKPISGIFRARPRHEVAFWGLPENCGKELWQQHHVLPPPFYTVSQEDFSLAAARAEAGIDIGTSKARRRVSSINFYANPLDEDGKVMSMAKWLHQHLRRAKETADKMAAMRNRTVFVSLDPAAPPTPDPKIILYADQLMQGYTFFVKPHGSQKWMSLCRRMVRVKTCFDNKSQVLCELEEEGSIGMTVMAAARPYVGVVASRPTSNEPSPFTLQVISVGNSNAFECTCTPDSRPGQKTQVGGVFRSRMSWDELLNDDMAIVTPLGGGSEEAKKSITATEVLVHPVLGFDKGLAPPPEVTGNAWFLQGAAKNRRLGTAMNAPLENFPVVISSQGTRFVDAKGRPIDFDQKKSDSDWNKIFGRDVSATVEGKRRYYALPWIDDRTFQEVQPLPIFDLQTTGRPPLAGILNELGAGDLLNRFHLDSRADHSCDLLTLPKPVGSGNADQLPPDSAGSLERQGLEQIGVRRKSSDELVLLRGFVESVGCEASFTLVKQPPSMGGQAVSIRFEENGMQKTETWYVAQPFSSLVSTQGGTYQFLLNFDGPLTVKSPGPNAAVGIRVRCRLKAANNVLTPVEKGADVEAEILSQAAKVADLPSAPFCFTWTLVLKTLAGSQQEITYSSQPFFGRKPTEEEGQRFLDPFHAAGCLVEAIGSPSGRVLTGRGWPQHPFATWLPGRDGGWLFFPDGTTHRVGNQPPQENSSDKRPRSSRFKVTKATNQAEGLDKQPLGHLVAGEVTRIVIPEVVDARTDTGDRSFEITDLNQQVWTIWYNKNDVELIQPASSLLPPRRISDLEVGEFLIARCDVNSEDSVAGADPRPAPPRHVRLQRAGSGGLVRGAICLLGKLEIPPRSLQTVASEGTIYYQPATILTDAGNRVEFWSEKSILQKSKDVMGRVITPALRVIQAETIAQFTKPSPDTGKPAPGFEKRPIHASVSEVITRWSGWSLTVPRPGKYDVQPASRQEPVEFESFRPDSNGGFVYRPALERLSGKDTWRLPRLRFGQRYRFCVRRVDLAGNHLYDEPLDSDVPNGCQGLRRLDQETLYSEIANCNKKQEECEEGEQFLPADPPLAPLIGFSPDRRQPIFARLKSLALPKQNGSASKAPAATGAAGYSPSSPLVLEGTVISSTADRVTPDDLTVAAFGREATLVLVTDAISKTRQSVLDAQADLLPPPCPVETTILGGKLDAYTDYRQVASMIRYHERYLDAHHVNGQPIDPAGKNSLMGLDRRGWLNYFGDSMATKWALRVQTQDFPVEKEACSGEIQFFKQWPIPLRFVLKLSTDRDALTGAVWHEPRGARGKPRTGSDLFRRDEQRGKTEISVVLPPGSTGSLQFWDVNDVNQQNHEPRRTIPLIHATNAAWERPHCENLAETVQKLSPAASSNRELTGTIELDVPSSGGYTVFGYWNETNDESVAVNHSPAEAIARINHLGQITHCEITNAGFGFSSAAVVLVAPPVRKPAFEAAISSQGTVRDVIIVDYGEGCATDFKIQVRPKRNVPGARMAVAVARVNSYGQVERLEILDRGAGLQASAVAIHSLEPELPRFTARCDQGRVVEIVVPPAPPKLFGDLRLKIIRRPPLVRCAAATAMVEQGRITSVAVTRRGGWYAAAPFVVVSDAKGDGWGADLAAELDAAGGVSKVVIRNGGSHYSGSVEVAFYTHRFQALEEPIVPAGAMTADGPAPRDSCGLRVRHAVGDLRGRSVDYFIELSSRFRDLLEPRLGSDAQRNQPILARLGRLGLDPNVWCEVPRLSLPCNVQMRSYIRPTKPDVAYLMPAFEWSTKLPIDTIPIEDLRGYFVGRERGRFTVRRKALIRIYLHRPWHVSGPEQLGIVVAPAMLATSQAPTNFDQKIDRQDGGSLNVRSAAALGSDEKEKGYEQEPLGGYAVHKMLRGVVSRWGFDPVWREAAFVPLTADRIPSRLTGSNYRQVEPEAEQKPDEPPPAFPCGPSWLALHEPAYDGAKEKWYVDVELDLASASDSINALPFVQLGLVTFQPNGIPGNDCSPPTLCDMYKVLGQRELSVLRSDRNTFVIDLRGEFDLVADDKLFPRREVVAKLILADSTLPLEVQSYLPSNEAPQPAFPGKEGAPIPPPSHLWTRELLAEPLRMAAADGYRGTLKIDPEVFEALRHPIADGQRRLAVQIEEYEIYPAAEAALGPAGGGTFTIDGVMCARRLVFSFVFEVGS